VRALDNLTPQVHEGGARPGYLAADVELEVGDVRDRDAVRRALAGVELFELGDLRREVRPLADLRALAELRRVIRRLRPDIVHTHSSKAGILGLTKHMAVELGPFGICVNSVAPSVVLTARVKAKWEARPPEEQRAILAALPLRRLAMPEEVATVIAFLASDDASYVNGVCIDINGGSYMV